MIMLPVAREERIHAFSTDDQLNPPVHHPLAGSTSRSLSL